MHLTTRQLLLSHGVETFALTAGCDSNNSYGQPAEQSAGRGNHYDAANGISRYLTLVNHAQK